MTAKLGSGGLAAAAVVRAVAVVVAAAGAGDAGPTVLDIVIVVAVCGELLGEGASWAEGAGAQFAVSSAPVPSHIAAHR